MVDNPSEMKIGRHSFLHHIERGLIGIGMSVIAYLLERAILRSIKREKTRP